MLSQVYYLLRSKRDGKYLVAYPRQDSESATPQGFLLLFREHYDALSYLNTHASGVAEQFAVESIAGNHVGALLERWNFTGVGIVQEPLLPTVEFLVR
jgi:hypothetical protein